MPLDGINSQASRQLLPGCIAVRYGVRHANHQRDPRDHDYSHPVVLRVLAAWSPDGFLRRSKQCPACGRYWLSSARQVRFGSGTGIKGWAPLGDMNVAKTSATPLVRFVAL